MCKKSFALRVSVLVAVAWLCALPASMVGQGLAVTVDDPRPLAAVVANLEDKFGWIVTYEDPRFLHPQDSRDVTKEVRKTSRAGQAPILVPRGGPFTFVEPSEIRSSAAQQPEVLQALLDQYAASGYPGKFAVRRTDSVFHVVPTATRNAKGAQQASTSILDKRISQTAGNRTVMDAVEILAAQTGLSVGRVPVSLFRHTQLTQTATNDTARNLLLGILKATDRPMSWRLLCAPGEAHPCVLNIRIVGISPLQGK
jgi:hypothetical protein